MPEPVRIETPPTGRGATRMSINSASWPISEDWAVSAPEASPSTAVARAISRFNPSIC